MPVTMISCVGIHRPLCTARPAHCASSPLGGVPRPALQACHGKSLRRGPRPASATGQGGGGGPGAPPTRFVQEADGGSGPSQHGSLLWATLVFAVLVAVGGVQGYRKKGSRKSLVASGSVAALLLLGATLARGSSPGLGWGLALAASAALGGYMFQGYLATRKPFPQGTFALLSLAYAFAYGRVVFRQAA